MFSAWDIFLYAGWGFVISSVIGMMTARWHEYQTAQIRSYMRITNMVAGAVMCISGLILGILSAIYAAELSEMNEGTSAALTFSTATLMFVFQTIICARMFIYLPYKATQNEQRRKEVYRAL